MAEQEKKIVLTVDTGESRKTVKSLKQEISDLKDAILNLEKGSDDYNDAVEQLTTSQRELNEVQALTKRTATALDGSYDALVHKMSQLKKEWRATNDEARRNELGTQIGQINQQLKDLDAELGNYQRNVGNYVSHWEGMPEVTRDFGTAMREMNESIEPTKQKFESVGKIASGVASGFAAVQGTMALLGIESENFEKTMIKIQAAMAIAQGIGGLQGLVEGIGKAKVAFEGFNKTIKTVSATMGKTGWIAIIMAVITAITLAVTAIKNKRKEVDLLTESLNKLDKRNENIIASDNERARQLERDIKLMQAQGATEEEVLNKRLEYNQLYLDASERNYKEAQKQYLGLKDSLSMGIKGVTQEDVDKAKEVYDAANAIFTEYSEKRKDILNDIVIAQIKAKEKLENNELPVLGDVDVDDVNVDITTTETKEVGYTYKEGDASKRSNILNSLYEQQYQRKLEYNRMSEEDEETKAQREYEINLELQEKKLENLKRFKIQAEEEGDATTALALAEEIADAELAIDKAKYEEKLRLEEEYKEKKIKITQQINQSISAAADVTQGILEITQAAYEKDGEISEKEAKKIKGMQIAIATMNMLAGITAALSGAFTTKTGPWDIALAAVQAATIAASGTANIMKIRNTDLTGSVTSGAQLAVTPNSNIYGTDLPMSYVRNVTTASEVDELNKEQRVYILESDIQESNKKVSIRESESSF